MGVAEVVNASVLGLVLLAAVTAWPIAWGLLARYRAALRARMGRAAPPTPRRVVTALGAVTPPDAVAPPPVRAPPVAASPAALATRARERRRAVWGRYLLAGAAQATVLAAATLVAAGGGFFPFRTLVVWTTTAWPTVLTVAVLSGFDRRLVARTVAVFVAVMVVGGIAGGSPAAGPVLLLLTAGPATVVVAPYLHRSVRAVGPLVFAFLAAGLAGALGLLFAATGSEVSAGGLVEVAVALDQGIVTVLVAVAIAGFGLAALLGGFGLRAFARLHRDDGLPDDLVVVGSVWAAFAALQGAPLGFERPALLLAAPVGWLVFVVLAMLRSGDDDPDGPRLLLLRVFGDDPTAEQLFRSITNQWQDVGPMRAVGGPDLARATVEPDEFLAWVGGRLDRLFIDGPASFRERRANPAGTDRHGRHRVDEFLCHDDTWRPVVEDLLTDTDLVIVDLRGLGPSNTGVAQELEMLAARRMLDRTLLVVEPTTDRSTAAIAVRAGGGDLDDACVVVLDRPRRLTLDEVLAPLS